jgi:hypothetical protein
LQILDGEALVAHLDDQNVRRLLQARLACRRRSQRGAGGNPPLVVFETRGRNEILVRSTASLRP